MSFIRHDTQITLQTWPLVATNDETSFLKAGNEQLEIDMPY